MDEGELRKEVHRLQREQWQVLQKLEGQRSLMAHGKSFSADDRNVAEEIRILEAKETDITHQLDEKRTKLLGVFKVLKKKEKKMAETISKVSGKSSKTLLNEEMFNGNGHVTPYGTSGIQKNSSIRLPLLFANMTPFRSSQVGQDSKCRKEEVSDSRHWILLQVFSGV